MAFLRQQDDEEQQQQAAPTLAPGAAQGGGGFVSGLSPSGQPAQPQKTPQQASGTGQFTNLKSWLDAGKGRDQAISGKGSSLLNTEKQQWTNAATPLRNATFNAATATDEQVQGAVKGMAGVSEQTKKNADGSSSGSGYIDPASIGQDQWGNWLPGYGPGAQPPKPAAKPMFPDLAWLINQKYQGPRTANYDQSNRQGLRHLDALSSTATVGNQLVKDAGGGPYRGGTRRMDDILFGADAASQKAIADNRKGGSDFINSVTKEKAELADKVAGFDKAAAEASNKARGQLETIGDQLTGGIQSRVDAANAKEQGRMLDRTTDSAVPEGFELGDWVSGSGEANLGNMVSGDESKQFAALRSLLGGDKYNVADTGDYQSGHWGIRERQEPDHEKYYNDERLAGTDVVAAGSPDYEWRGDKLERVSDDWYFDQGKYVNKKTKESITPEEAAARKQAAHDAKVKSTIDGWRG